MLKLSIENIRNPKIRMWMYRGAILAALIVLIAAGQLDYWSDNFGPDNIRVESDFDLINYLQYHVPSIFQSIYIVFVAYLLYLVFAVVPKKAVTKENAFATALKLFGSFVKYVIFVVAVLLILRAWGVDTTTLLVSAGIMGLIIGLGAQSLIADIIAGLFIVFDGEFKVGDIIVIDGWRGEVKDIGMRTTKIEDTGGNIKIINNSSISAVVNQTAELSLAVTIVSIAFEEPLQKVELIFGQNLRRVHDKIPEIVEGPFYRGVNKLNDNNVDLLFVAKVKESDIYAVQRAMKREFFLIMVENGITLSYNRIIPGTPAPIVTPQPTEQEKSRADRFAARQRKLAKDADGNFDTER